MSAWHIHPLPHHYWHLELIKNRTMCCLTCQECHFTALALVDFCMPRQVKWHFLEWILSCIGPLSWRLQVIVYYLKSHESVALQDEEASCKFEALAENLQASEACKSTFMTCYVYYFTCNRIVYTNKLSTSCEFKMY